MSKKEKRSLAVSIGRSNLTRQPQRKNETTPSEPQEKHAVGLGDFPPLRWAEPAARANVRAAPCRGSSVTLGKSMSSIAKSNIDELRPTVIALEAFGFQLVSFQG